MKFALVLLVNLPRGFASSGQPGRGTIDQELLRREVSVDRRAFYIHTYIRLERKKKKTRSEVCISADLTEPTIEERFRHFFLPWQLLGKTFAPKVKKEDKRDRK